MKFFIRFCLVFLFNFVDGNFFGLFNPLTTGTIGRFIEKQGANTFHRVPDRKWSGMIVTDLSAFRQSSHPHPFYKPKENLVGFPFIKKLSQSNGELSENAKINQSLLMEIRRKLADIQISINNLSIELKSQKIEKQRQQNDGKFDFDADIEDIVESIQPVRHIAHHMVPLNGQTFGIKKKTEGKDEEESDRKTSVLLHQDGNDETTTATSTPIFTSSSMVNFDKNSKPEHRMGSVNFESQMIDRSSNVIEPEIITDYNSGYLDDLFFDDDEDYDDEYDDDDEEDDKVKDINARVGLVKMRPKKE